MLDRHSDLVQLYAAECTPPVRGIRVLCVTESISRVCALSNIFTRWDPEVRAIPPLLSNYHLDLGLSTNHNLF
jgi:hypothetical protein